MKKEAIKLALEAFETLTQYNMVRANIFRRFEPTCTGDYVDLREFREKAEPAIAALREAQQEPKPPEFYAQLEYDTPGWDVVAAVYQRREDATPLLVHRETLPNQQPAHPPLEMTPEMMRKVQVHSELGAYASANLSGAYDLFQEFWRVAMSVAPQPAQQQKPVAWRAWFDADNGARWLFSIWPEEERLDVEWQPLYTSTPAQRKPLPVDEILHEYMMCDGLQINTEFNSLIRFARAIEAAHNIKEQP